MAIKFKQTKFEGRHPSIWRGECKVLPAGFKIENAPEVGVVVAKGTLVAVDFNNRSAYILPLAKSEVGSTTTKFRVAKGTPFKAGEVISNGTNTATISAVDRTNAEYDLVTTSTAITGASVGDTLSYVRTKLPNAVVAADLVIGASSANTLDAAYEACVLVPSLGGDVPSEYVQGITLKNNPNVILIKQ